MYSLDLIKKVKLKEDGVEFGSDEIEGQFMEREVDGFNEELAVVMAYDDKGKTEGRDTIFNSIFGKNLILFKQLQNH